MRLRILELRREKEMTQTGLAKLAGYTQTQIWRWENHRECPSAFVVFNLIKVLGVKPNDMFEGEWLSKNLVAV